MTEHDLSIRLAAMTCCVAVKTSLGRYAVWLTSMLMVVCAMPATFVLTGTDIAISSEPVASQSIVTVESPRAVLREVDDTAAVDSISPIVAMPESNVPQSNAFATVVALVRLAVVTDTRTPCHAWTLFL